MIYRFKDGYFKPFSSYECAYFWLSGCFNSMPLFSYQKVQKTA
jgi:hypothetical protein